MLRHELARWIGHRDRLRLGLRRRIVNRLAPPDSFASRMFETDYRGGRYRGEIAELQGWLTWFFGGYELKELALIDDVLRRLDAPVALDIGGNVGGHALAMARHAEQVHIFEPFGPLADRVAEQIALNGHSHLHLHRVGLADESAVRDYYLDTEGRNQGTGSFLPDHSEGGKAGELRVVRGDDWLRDKVEKVDFIKIDIEGFEAPALLGLSAILERDNPVIVMEVTESSEKLFARHGGYDAVLPFAFDMWRIVNPPCRFGLWQSGDYRLRPIDAIVAEGVSHNVLIVPEDRRSLLAPLIAGMAE